MACALWRKRHADLLPAVRRGLESLSPPAAGFLRALLTLLEKSPDALGAWALEPSVLVEHKT